jgi:hypothetical protein
LSHSIHHVDNTNPSILPFTSPGRLAKYLHLRATNFDYRRFNQVLTLLDNDDEDNYDYTLSPDHLSWFLAALIVALTSAYGGIHISAWN